MCSWHNYNFNKKTCKDAAHSWRLVLNCKADPNNAWCATIARAAPDASRIITLHCPTCRICRYYFWIGAAGAAATQFGAAVVQNTLQGW